MCNFVKKLYENPIRFCSTDNKSGLRPSGSNFSFDPWTKGELYDTGQLAQLLTDKSKTNDPAIFNIGPVSNIKGAIAVGAASQEEGISKLKEQLKILAKDKEIIVYCGCCPFNKCPNVRPAFSLLKKEGYTKVFLLNLPENIHKNWISKGYPVEKE